MRVYISGPMRGVPLYNFPAFDAAATRLGMACGSVVFNPADEDRRMGFDPAQLPFDHDWSTLPDGLTVRDCADRDLEALKYCDTIYMLKGWEKSKGASAERAVAEWLGLAVIYEAESNPRKRIPIASGVLNYFPDAIRAVAHCSWVGNEQHNKGEPLHWSRDKSNDHADCMMRHFMERGAVDEDGVRHMAKAAWRALALLQLELEVEDAT